MVVEEENQIRANNNDRNKNSSPDLSSVIEEGNFGQGNQGRERPQELFGSTEEKIHYLKKKEEFVRQARKLDVFPFFLK